MQSTSRRRFMRGIGAGLAAAALGPAARSAGDERKNKPNILLIIADDLTFNDLPAYGGTNIETPNIDRLIGQSKKFNNAYVSMSMCCPCRHELYSGRYPMSSGATWNHCTAKPGTKSVCHYLGDRGYRVGLAGKCHVSPRSSYPFAMVKGFPRGCCSKHNNYTCDGMRAFITAEPGRPFFLALGLILSHTPWTVGDPGQFDPAKLKLPPSFADTPALRADYAKYLAEIVALDTQIGDILAHLEKTGRAGDTMVIFTSEQGGQWPGAKWTCWELGMHTAFAVRWPGVVKGGTETDAIIQYADVVPTLIAAAGGDPAAHPALDGRSFLDVLLDKKDAHRTYAYGMHNNVPEGPPYPIRTIRSAAYRYIRNLTPAAEYVEKHMEVPKKWGDYWESWKKAAKTDSHARKMYQRFRRRPAEELYRSNEDVYELKNLADDPRYAAITAKLRAALERWMRDEGDPGAARDDRAVLEANRRAGRAEDRRYRRAQKK